LLGAAASKLPVTRELFEAYLGALEFLETERRDTEKETSGEQFVIKIVRDKNQPAEIHTVALRMLRPDHPSLTADNLKSFLSAKDPALRSEAVRTLALRSDAASQDLLRKLAKNAKEANGLRADAIAGLTHSSSTPETRKLLLAQLKSGDVSREALRSLREVGAEADVEKALFDVWNTSADVAREERREQAGQILLALRGSKSDAAEKHRKDLSSAAAARPTNEADWKKRLSQKGDAEAGRRVFFHKNGPRCFACHQIDGRGAKIGPDLSKIGRSAPREKIIESILTPSKEIAPLFVAWNIITRDGKTHTGLIIAEGSIGGAPGSYTLADANGKIEVVKLQDVEERHALATSIMPDNLAEQMTPREFVDLVEFLCGLK
jgi:putative heme-binding domain-containing protein